MQPTKAVFPVAGLGTRFLPATKVTAKEMLPVVDKPLIQYAVEEAVAAGVTELIFITGRTKNAIMDHFDTAYELEAELAARGKDALLQVAQDVVPNGVSCVFIRQPQALGLGHAVLCAKPAVGNEPFAVILPDDMVDNDGDGCIAQLFNCYNEKQGSVIAVEEVDPAHTNRYGIVDVGGGSGQTEVMKSVVEKPDPAEAPSNLAIIGRYVLTPRIFDLLETTQRGAGNEIQLTDAIADLMKEEAAYAHRFEGTRYDCGDKLGFLTATVELALKHPEVGDGFRSYLKDQFGS